MPMDEMLYYRLGQKRGGGGGTSGGGADWAASEGEAGYVKNRTHWEEEGIVTLVDNETLTGFSEMKNGIYFVNTPTDWISIEIGKTYTVIWDGETYECGCVDVQGMACLGNPNYMMMQHGGDYPFAWFVVGGEAYLVTELSDESHTATIRAEVMVVHHLDPKYIKDMYYEEGEPVVVLEEQTFEFYTDGLANGDPAGFDIEIPRDKTLVVGKTYTVIWDGHMYENLVCVETAEGFPCMGARLEDLLNGSSEYPFYINCYIDPNFVEMSFTTMSAEPTHTVSILKNDTVIRKIPEKYLPMEHIEDQIENYISNALGGKY